MTVETLIADARSYAQTTISDAKSALNGASEMVRAVGYVIPNFQPAVMPPLAKPTALPLPPVLTDVIFIEPVAPANALMFQDVAPIVVGVAPVFEVLPPVLIPPLPILPLPAFTDRPPQIDVNQKFPEPPSSLLNPLLGELRIADRKEPDKPQTMLPAFSGDRPTGAPLAPTDLETRFSDSYHSAAPSTIAMMEGYVDSMLTKYNPRYKEQMARIETQLAKYLDGGTALAPAVENAIYERAKDKNNAEARRVRDLAFGDAAGRGFTLPTGALYSAIQQARQDGANNNARASTEITVMQAEMEQKNLQFAVTTSTGLRTALLGAALSYHQNLISINGQAIEYAKTVLSSIIQIYNLSVQAFQVKLEAYKVDANVYETKLKSALAGIELYQAEVKALEALTNVDRAKIDVYRARIDSLVSLSNVYRAQVDAVVARSSLERLKLDLFQANVQAYTAQVQGKEAEYRGFTAAIEGQTAQVKTFSVQVEAFNSKVQAFRADIDAKSEVVRASAIVNQARASQYTATLSGYTATVAARGEVAKTKIENQRQSVLRYQATTQAIIANAQLYADYYRATSTVVIENSKLQLSAQVQEADSTRAFGASIASLGTSSAQVYAGLAGAAMSGINTLTAELKNE